MSENKKHTPLPWFFSGSSLMGKGAEFGSVHIITAKEILKLSEEDKAFLITAVNNHYSLLEALKKLMETAAKTTANLCGFDGAEELDSVIDEGQAIINRINNNQ